MSPILPLSPRRQARLKQFLPVSCRTGDVARRPRSGVGLHEALAMEPLVS